MRNLKQLTPFDNIFKPVISNMALMGSHLINNNLIRKLWWYFLFIALIFWMILSFVHMKQMKSVEQIGDVVVNISCISQPVVGLFTIRKYRKNIVEILNTIQNKFWFNEKNIDKKMFLKHELFYGILSKISFGYQGVCYTCTTIWFLEPIFHSSGKFAMDMTFPHNNFIKQYPYFPFIYFIQAITVFISANLVVLLDIIYIASLGFGLIQIDLIKQKLKMLNLDSNEKQMYEDLKKCIDQHNIILDLFKKIEKIYRLLMLDKLLCDILCLCCATYILNLQKNLNLKFLLIMVASGSQPFLYCFFGDFVTSECESIGEKAYSVNWENRNHKSIIFGLSMMILRSQKQVLMTAGGMIIFSLPSYVAFIRLLFSFYIALEQLDNK